MDYLEPILIQITQMWHFKMGWYYNSCHYYLGCFPSFLCYL